MHNRRFTLVIESGALFLSNVVVSAALPLSNLPTRTQLTPRPRKQSNAVYRWASMPRGTSALRQLAHRKPSRPNTRFSLLQSHLFRTSRSQPPYQGGLHCLLTEQLWNSCLQTRRIKGTSSPVSKTNRRKDRRRRVSAGRQEGRLLFRKTEEQAISQTVPDQTRRANSGKDELSEP